MKKVSIILPVYNAASYIEKCIIALYRQTYENLEIIVINDGSTDGTFDLIQNFKSPKLKIISTNNQGAAMARNEGLKLAEGDFIQFMDADDFLSYQKIEKQVSVLQGREDVVAVCNYVNFEKDEDLMHIKPADQSHFIFSSTNTAAFLANLWGANGKSNFIQTNSWLTPRTLIDKVGYWKEYRCPDDDGEFFSRVLLAAKEIIYVPGVFNYYRRNSVEGQTLSGNRNLEYLSNTLETIKLKEDRLLMQLDTYESRKAIARQYLDYAVYNYPQQKALSSRAFSAYKKFNIPLRHPLLGGKLITIVADLFGWKAARMIRNKWREKI